ASQSRRRLPAHTPLRARCSKAGLASGQPQWPDVVVVDNAETPATTAVRQSASVARTPPAATAEFMAFTESGSLVVAVATIRPEVSARHSSPDAIAVPVAACCAGVWVAQAVSVSPVAMTNVRMPAVTTRGGMTGTPAGGGDAP